MSASTAKCTLGGCEVELSLDKNVLSVQVTVPTGTDVVHNIKRPDTNLHAGDYAVVPYSEGVTVTNSIGSNESSDDEDDPSTAYVLVTRIESDKFYGAWVYNREELDSRLARTVPATFDCVLTTHECGPFTFNEASTSTPSRLATHVIDWQTKQKTRLEAKTLASIVKTVEELRTTEHACIFDAKGHAATLKSTYAQCTKSKQRDLLACANALYSGAPSSRGLAWWQDPQRILKELDRLDAIAIPDVL